MNRADFDEACEESAIVIDDDEMLKSESDSDSDECNSNSSELGFCISNGMIRIEEGRRDYVTISESFVSSMGDFGKQISVVAIHKNSFSSSTGKARSESFRVFSEAVANKCGGSANIKHGWYGGSKDEISQIIAHGFSDCKLPKNGDSYGLGVYLSPAKFSIDSVLSAVPDENGLRHVLLCRVILGNAETIHPGSNQFYPSSKNFDSGVDNLSDPRKYIIWSAYMNSHIFPNYIISFRSPPYIGAERMRACRIPKPTSPWMSFPSLVAMLSRFLSPQKMEMINRYYSRYRENKLSRQQLIQKLRQIAGDNMLATVIKNYRNKVDGRSGLKAAI